MNNKQLKLLALFEKEFIRLAGVSSQYANAVFFSLGDNDRLNEKTILRAVKEKTRTLEVIRAVWENGLITYKLQVKDNHEALNNMEVKK